MVVVSVWYLLKGVVHLGLHSHATFTLLAVFVLQCFDAVGWVTGRASGLEKLGIKTF